MFVIKMVFIFTTITTVFVFVIGKTILKRSLLYRIREKSFMRLNLYLLTVLPLADPDLQLRGRGCVFDLLALPAFLPSVISSFFTQNKGGPSPRSATGYVSQAGM